ncbi:MAG: SDR family oxidoreductase [bacterium]|nr:SDR family oxidoreductase [bacterium]
MATIIMTGATGTVGSVLVKKLLKGGHKILCIVRSAPNCSAQERLNHAIGLRSENAVAVEGDITKSLCGVSADDLSCLSSTNFEIFIHAAASTKFDESCREESFLKNFFGTQNALNLHRFIHAEIFHYISTVYVGGACDKLQEDGQCFVEGRNPYEESKRQAEFLVLNSGLSYLISRLGIVVGDSTTGAIGNFSGMYGFFIPFHILAERERVKIGLTGVQYGVELPLIVKRGESTLNIVPVNWVADMLFNISFNAQCVGKILHVIHPAPPLVDWVIDQSFDILGIQGIRKTGSVTRQFSAKQRVVNPILDLYQDYITHEAVFAVENLPRLLGGDYCPPAKITKRLLELLFQYATRYNFGRGAEQPRLAAV